MRPDPIASLARSRAMQWICLGIMLLGLPLAGVGMAGREIAPYLQFPPLTRPVAHAPFSWAVFAFYTLLDLTGALFIWYLLRGGPRRAPENPTAGRSFPRWGWLGLALMLAGWALAWTRMRWFSAVQHHTFVLPWLGYILLVNALDVRRTGQSLLTGATARFAALFPVSALFWWFFEYLNRFAQNWHYVGVEDLGAAAYIAFASLAFATVLPAVLSTYRLLLGFAPFRHGLRPLAPPPLRRPRLAAAVMLAAAGGGLLLLGLFPDWLFALLWVSPLLILTALQLLSGRPTVFSNLARGDWRPAVTTALAALVCGFFWEMWNYGSLAQWRYALPFVDRFRIFAMPILGYGGYLPFGLECLVVGAMVLGRRPLALDENGGAQ